MQHWGRRQPTRPEPVPPAPHPSGATPPKLRAGKVPQHVAIVMDGNGRWANQRGLPRTEGHKAGEAVVLDVLQGAIEIGVTHLSLYAFSTENWRRSPAEVKFLMGFNRDVIHRRRDRMNELGVRVHWVGRNRRLWRSVHSELVEAEELTKQNDTIHLYMCLNYGARAEIADAAQALARDVQSGKLNPDKVNEAVFARYLYRPQMPDVDLMIRPSGERRISNFLLWQAWYAELVVQDILWPDFDRRSLWAACAEYADRDRRHGAEKSTEPGADESAEPGADGSAEPGVTTES